MYRHQVNVAERAAVRRVTDVACSMPSLGCRGPEIRRDMIDLLSGDPRDDERVVPGTLPARDLVTGAVP
jgi:hypothetical protein